MDDPNAEAKARAGLVLLREVRRRFPTVDRHLLTIPQANHLIPRGLDPGGLYHTLDVA